MAPAALVAAKDIVRVKDQDADSVFQFMRSFCGQHGLGIHKKGDLRFGYYGTAKPRADISFGYLEYGTAVTVCLGDGIENYSVSLPLQGTQTVYQGRERCLSEPRKAIVLSPAREIAVDIDSNWRSVFITINRRIVDLELRRLTGAATDRPLIFDTEMSTDSSQSASWWRAVRYYMREMSAEGSIATHPTIAAEFERSLVRALLITQPSNYSSDILRSVTERVPQYVLQSKRYIDENYDEDISLESIREVAGVSAGKLRDAFKEYTGTTPMQYLKRVRLNRAREELLKSGTRQNVSSVALDAGFNHLGRFSIEYKKAFGESPTQTASRANDS